MNSEFHTAGYRCLKIRLISDIHCEFDSRNPHGEFFPPELRDDPDTVLVAAGDIHVGENAAFWLNRTASRFRAVIYVTGNHEYYHSCLYPDSEWLTMYLEHDDIHILQGEQVSIDEFDFIGATL